MPVIGYLSGLSPTATPTYLAAFRQGLDAGGYVEGRSVAIEYRWAEGHYHLLPALAADLVRRQVAVIAATGGTASVLRLRRQRPPFQSSSTPAAIPSSSAW